MAITAGAPGVRARQNVVLRSAFVDPFGDRPGAITHHRAAFSRTTATSTPSQKRDPRAARRTGQEGPGGAAGGTG